jgi:hypothetical protein
MASNVRGDGLSACAKDSAVTLRRHERRFGPMVRAGLPDDATRSRHKVTARAFPLLVQPSKSMFKDLLSKENIINFVVIAAAAAVGVVIVGPWVSKLWAKVPFGKA